MPVIAPLVKQSRCRELGADVILFGSNIGEAKAKADEFVALGATYVHGFDDPAVIAGAGTVGLELMDQAQELDAIVVPVGGAGLVAGLGVAAKRIRPEIQIIGVEPESAPSYLRAWQVGTPMMADILPTLADGLAVPMVGVNAFAIARNVVDRVVTVDEASIALAILRLLELEKGVVEGAGAIGLAALLAGKLPELAGKRVALVLCGGNIDPAVLGRVIEMGLVADGRLAQFKTTISDRPGGLAMLTKTLADLGASIKQITHERAFGGADVSKVEVECTIETRDRQHLNEVLAALPIA
jgi:threonine dehydratase